MKLTRCARWCCAGLVLVLAGAALIGCKSNAATPAATTTTQDYTYTSQTLTTTHTDALSAASQLMLGMIRLEGTANAITAEQAKTLLPVVQSLQGQVLKADAERDAVWAYVEAQLTPAQLAAVTEMRLAQNDLQTWMRESGPGAGGPGMGGPVPQGTPGAPGAPGGQPAPGGTRPAQGGMPQAPGGAQTGGARSGAQTGGARSGRSGVLTGGGIGASSGQSNVLLTALIRLLSQRAPKITPTAASAGRTVAAPQATAIAPTAKPTSTPMVTATATLTPTKSSAVVPAATPQSPAAFGAGGTLVFTGSHIEYAPSAPRYSDRKIQLTIQLKPQGGTAPFSFILDGTTQVNGLTYTFDWHNCGESEPHTIELLSADGQKSEPVKFMYPYAC